MPLPIRLTVVSKPATYTKTQRPMHSGRVKEPSSSAGSQCGQQIPGRLIPLLLQEVDKKCLELTLARKCSFGAHCD